MDNGGCESGNLTVRRDLLVLCYHAVSPSWRCTVAVRPDELERQLWSLTRLGWVGATFSKAVLDPPAKRTLAVTFDDAFSSVVSNALPILSSLGIPATVYAPTSFMSRRQSLSWPGIDHWRDTADREELTSMSWDDLGSLADQRWEIGSHTRTHPHLTTLSDSALTEELVESRADCFERLGRECVSIAYPYGDLDERVIRRTRDAGYLTGAACHSFRRHDRYRQPRVGVYDIDVSWRFRLKTVRLIRTVWGMGTRPAV